MNDGAHIRDLLEKEEFEKIISYIKSSKLETLSTSANNAIFRVFLKLETYHNYNKIIELLNIIAKYEIDVLKYEFKEGVKILINSK